MRPFDLRATLLECAARLNRSDLVAAVVDAGADDQALQQVSSAVARACVDDARDRARQSREAAADVAARVARQPPATALFARNAPAAARSAAG